MVLKQILVATIGFIVLILWYSGYQVSCLILVIPFLIGVILAKANFEYSNARKKCLADCYFNQDTMIHTLLTKKVFVLLLSILSGIFLSTILILNIITFNISDFILLFMDMIFIVMIYNYIQKTQFLQNNIKYPILKNTTSIISSGIFMIIFLLVSFYQTPPLYIQDDLVQTIHIASN